MTTQNINQSIRHAYTLLWPFQNSAQLNELIQRQEYDALLHYFQTIERNEAERARNYHPFYDENYHNALQEFIVLLEHNKNPLQSVP